MSTKNSTQVPLAVLLAAAAVCLLGCQPSTTVVAAPATMQGGTSIAPKTIYYDSFNSVKSEWQQMNGIWETRTDTGYRIQKNDDPAHLNAISYVQTPRVVDATIEALVRVNPAHAQYMNPSVPLDAEKINTLRYTMGAGIVFRLQDQQNYYMFRLAGEEGAVVGKMVNGEWFDLCNPRVRGILEGSRIGFRSDNWYRLRLDAYGRRITAYINDEPVCDVQDGTFTIGQVGLVTFKTAADFDYFQVTNKETEVRTQ
jgi:hypothetical protein